MTACGSLFSGIGGIDLACERAGMSVAWQCEIDKSARRVLSGRWPNVEQYDDIRTIDGGQVPPVDVLVGGFPCQDLSVAGNRAGLAGERSGLFFEVMRLARELTPQWLLLENVPGLLSSNGGRDMGTVVGALAELGYGWSYRVLDAQFFGVPQRRRRVFIVGCLGDAASAAKVLFEPESCDRDSPPSQETGHQLDAVSAGSIGASSDNVTVASTMTNHAPRYDASSETFVFESRVARNGRGAPSDVVPPLMAQNGQSGKGDGAPLVAFSWHRTQFSAASSSPTLTNSDGHPPAVCGPLIAHTLTRLGCRTGEDGDGRGLPLWPSESGIRRLTPTECLRLQGLPDDWLDLDPPLSDSAKYMLIGNSVAVPCVEWITRRIAKEAM